MFNPKSCIDRDIGEAFAQRREEALGFGLVLVLRHFLDASHEDKMLVGRVAVVVVCGSSLFTVAQDQAFCFNKKEAEKDNKKEKLEPKWLPLGFRV